MPTTRASLRRFAEQTNVGPDLRLRLRMHRHRGRVGGLAAGRHAVAAARKVPVPVRAVQVYAWRSRHATGWCWVACCVVIAHGVVAQAVTRRAAIDAALERARVVASTA